MESRTVDLPKDGDRWRLIGTPSIDWFDGTGGTGGISDFRETCCGIWVGSWPDRAKKASAVIHRPCRSRVVAVNLRARSGVRIKIDLFQAEESSGDLGNGV